MTQPNFDSLPDRYGALKLWQCAIWQNFSIASDPRAHYEVAIAGARRGEPYHVEAIANFLRLCVKHRLKS